MNRIRFVTVGFATALIFGILFFSNCLPVGAQSTVRVKDIASVRGVQENQLTGFGLVTGLNGKGDSEGSAILQYVLSTLIDRFGISIPSEEIKVRNCAVVSVSADIPRFTHIGDRVSVRVSSIVDAKSLEGGVLLKTQLTAGDGTVYATAQGMTVASSDVGGMKTVAVVPDGAVFEREAASRYIENNTVSVVLHNPDFSTAHAVATAIVDAIPESEVTAIDASLVRVGLSDEEAADPVGFISRIEKLTVEPDVPAKVVINPNTGVVVMGKNVTIGRVGVSYKQDKISVGRRFGEEEDKEHFFIEDNTTVQEFVSVLQDVGITTDIIIEILKAIERSGALYGKLIVM